MEDMMAAFNRVKLLMVMSAFLTMAWFGVAHATNNGPFAKSCPQGRYTMATTGWDITQSPYAPMALSGMVNLVCTGTRSGTYTGLFYATYPDYPGTIICQITGGTYTIDPSSGSISSSATLSGDGCIFSNPNLAEIGFLSDPSGNTISEVEIGQNWGDQIHYLWQRSN